MNDVKKGLFHSELVRRSPLILTIKSEATQSKFSGKPDFITVFDHENSMERQYQCENEHVGEMLGEWKGVCCEVKAGDRDEKAWVELEEVEEPAAPRQQQRREAPPRRQEPTRGRQEQPRRPAQQEEPTERQQPRKMTAEEKKAAADLAYKKAAKYAMQTGVLMEMSIRVISRLAKLAHDEEGLTFEQDAIERLVVTHFIEAKSRVDISALPVVAPPKKQKEEQPPARQPDPEPEPEPEPAPPEIEDEDIPWT